MISPILAGLKCVCPHCGEGKLFAGYLKLAPTCNKCGFDLKAEDTADGPAVFVIFALGLIITPLAVYVGLTTNMSPLMQGVLWTVVTLGSALALLPPLKAYTVALQYQHRRASGGKL